MRIDLSNKNSIFEIKEEIAKNDYRNCEIVVSKENYNLIKSFDGVLFKTLNKMLEERRITLLKKENH